MPDGNYKTVKQTVVYFEKNCPSYNLMKMLPEINISDNILQNTLIKVDESSFKVQSLIVLCTSNVIRNC